jgi:exodeoxyribonuclease VII large subunit
MEVKVFGNPRIYVPYGKYSFTVQRVEPVGEGALRRAFELTKKKLHDEGLFSPQHKKEIPRFPKLIGIVTSEEAAAYTDFLRILNNRWGGVTTILRPSLVQGVNAPDQIVDAIEWFNKYKPVDVMVITRGGGSMEDLMAFNSEQVCRAIFASKIPVICGVGHERDITLAELTADIRASTPSNAAEIAVPDREEIAYQVNRFSAGMGDSIMKQVADLKWELQDLLSRMENVIRDKGRAFGDLEYALSLAFERYQGMLQQYHQRVNSLRHRLSQSSGVLFTSYSTELAQIDKLLKSFSPKSVLNRGYSITRSGNGKVLTSAKKIKKGEVIQTELSDGSLTSEVRAKGRIIENKRLF